jgi:hypothetical protein
MSSPGRRRCVDSPDEVPHLVDTPRALRCDQHREQRHRWSDANGYRRRTGRKPLPWVPDPLTPERRRDALALLTNEHGWELLQIAHALTQSANHLQAKATIKPDSRIAEAFYGHLQAVADQAQRLHDLAKRMGHEFPG